MHHEYAGLRHTNRHIGRDPLTRINSVQLVDLPQLNPRFNGLENPPESHIDLQPRPTHAGKNERPLKVIKPPGQNLAKRRTNVTPTLAQLIKGHQHTPNAINRVLKTHAHAQTCENPDQLRSIPLERNADQIEIVAVHRHCRSLN